MTQPSEQLQRALRERVTGEVWFDAMTRGLYAADASIYQIVPLGVVIPRTDADVAATIAFAREFEIPVTVRGAGTSQCGQTVGAGIVIDTSKYLHGIIAIDAERRRARVQPGLVLDQLNATLRPHGLFFPVDPSTASHATIGGMTANNSSGARSIRYGNMVHNVIGIDAVLADGTQAAFGNVTAADVLEPPRYRSIVAGLRAIAARESHEIATRFPKVLRRVGGYNLDLVAAAGFNTASVLVGSEGTLAYFTAIELALQPLPKHAVLGICHFPRFHDAMAATPALVTLGPVAVELIDRAMIELARENPEFAPATAQFVRGEPDALLFVEFTGDDLEPLRERLADLDATMRGLGFANAVVAIADTREQAAAWAVRSAGLNIMSSMKGDAKPVSIIEDCAVPLEHLAAYTERLNAVFAAYGTRATWYAHASVGCLHVRPVLNMKSDLDVGKLRAIAGDAFALVREYGGSHSGEHGDGIVRSEFHREMFGDRLVRAFEDVKDLFDPAGTFNPGKIVRAPKMDDRSLFRYGPEYRAAPIATRLDWSEWGGLLGAVEMCNNNGTCRKATAVMCPSYLVTRDERDVTRGRANALRLALTGQLGPDALSSDAMRDVFDLCVGCKACKRECPTGVDMARMKIEFLAQYHERHPIALMDRLVAALPRLAPSAARFAPLANLRNRLPLLARLTERATGISAKRRLPAWRRDVFDDRERTAPIAANAPEVVLFVDTFDRYFAPQIAHAARTVLEGAGYDVRLPRAADGGRPLCCGRTYLSAGLVGDARTEARRTIAALQPFVARGVPIVGLEPSCLLTLRDEFLALEPGDQTRALAKSAVLFEEFVARERAAGRFGLAIRPQPPRTAMLHGHCHQKAFGAMDAVRATLALLPNLDVRSIESSCCGMAGSFGYEARHYDTSMAMAERSLFPALRAAPPNAIIVADGFSCRHQIADGIGLPSVHVAELLAESLDA